MGGGFWRGNLEGAIQNRKENEEIEEGQRSRRAGNWHAYYYFLLDLLAATTSNYSVQGDHNNRKEGCHSLKPSAQSCWWQCVERHHESRSMAGGGPKSDCSLRPPAYGDMGLGIQTEKKRKKIIHDCIRITPYDVLELQNEFGFLHENKTFLANIILRKKEGHMTKNTAWYRPYQYVLLNWYCSSKRGMGQVWSQ